MTALYSIADHIIQITAPDISVLQEACPNYSPFEINPDGNDAKDPDAADSDSGHESDAARHGKQTRSPLCHLEIVEHLQIPEASAVYEVKEKGYPGLSFSRFDGGWVIRMAPDADLPAVGTLIADEDFRNARLKMLSTDERAVRFDMDNAMMLLFAIASAPLDTLEIHSSVTVCEGAGYAFLGKSGTGKSTHSRLWRENIPGSTLLNDDNPVIRIKDGQVRIYGTPWSGKTPCYKADSAPLGAVVRIRQCPENKIQRLSPVEAYASLFSSSSAFREIRGTADGIHSTISKIVSLVPMYLLDCRPDAEAAQLCHSTAAPK